MKSIKLFKISLVFATITFSTFSYAGEAFVTWGDTNKFADVQPSNGAKKNYIQRVQKSLTEEFSSLAENLPAGLKLFVDIKDVDLAGKVNPMIITGGSSVRILTDIDFPKIIFNYKVTNIADEIVLENTNVIIKDMNYLRSTINHNSTENFYYEAKMISDWFRADVLKQVE